MMDGRRLAALLCPLLLISVATASIFDNNRNKKCQPIEIPLCKDIPYNETFYPNLLGHTDQASLNMQTEHFKPLIHTNCSPHIKFFVCSVFAPMCPEAFPQAVTSCREVCLQVQRDCMSILTGFGIGWPEPLDCSKFPQAPELCMKPTDNHDSYASNAPTVGTGHVDPLKEPQIDIFPTNPAAKCPGDMIDLDPTDPIGACGVPCSHDVMFQEQNKKFAEMWMLIWASICLVVTGFTVLTYLLDRSRFRYPERCIIYLAACYHLYSWVYLVRVLFLTYEQSACEQLRSGSAYLTAGGLDNPKCVLSFMVLYYFSLASSLWWVILTFAWYLSAGRKWGPEGIEAWSSYFHFVAWGTPALLSIAVLITHKVDASELTGLCFVGNSDPLALWGFVIGPRIFFILIGGCFLIAGFASICTVRESLRSQGRDTSKLEKLMVKVAIFSVLYIIPAVLIIACDSYHALLLREWQPVTTACKARGGNDIACRRPKTLPQLEVYIMNIFMSLIVGTTAGMWIGSRKTCTTWQNILCCGLLSPPGAKYPNGGHPGASGKPLMAPTTAAFTASRTSGQTQGTFPAYQMTLLPQPQPHPQSVSSYSSCRRQYQPMWLQPTTTASSDTSKAV